MKITGFDVVDVRFPTSLVNAGTDAVHTDPGLLGRLRHR